MYTRILVCLCTLSFAAMAAADVYKWVDEDGVVHYSDQPHAGAEVVALPKSPAPPQRAPAPLPRTTAAPNRDNAAAPTDDVPFAYDSLEVASPAAEETLWNIAGTLNVALSLQPGLRRGDRVRIYFDGQPQPVGALQFQLEEVWRGEHNLQAEVLDQAGELMIRSEPIRFYVQQTSINN